jgi:hypothetical protein
MSGYFFPSDGNGESKQGSLAPYLETVYSNERLESRFTSELESTWQILVENNVCEDTATEKTAFIAREEQRYFKIRDAVQEAAAGYEGRLLVLFDVDENIAENLQPVKVPYPGFLRAVRELTRDLGLKFEIGFLSTIDDPKLRAETQTPTYMKGVTERINERYVISTRRLLETDTKLQNIDSIHTRARESLASSEEIEELLQSVEYVADPYLINRVRAQTTPEEKWQAMVGWLNIKLVIINALAHGHPEYERDGFRIINVDDYPNAAAINPDITHVRGVWTGPEVHEALYRTSLTDPH